MAGLLDMQQMNQEAAFRGLLGTMLGIGQASGPSPVPNNLMGALTQGGIAGLQAYDASQDAQLKRGLLRLQMQDAADKREELLRTRQAYAALPGLLNPGVDRRGIGAGLLATGVPALANTGIGLLTAERKAPTALERFNEQTGQREKLLFDPESGQMSPFGGQEINRSPVPFGAKPDGSVDPAAIPTLRALAAAGQAPDREVVAVDGPSGPQYVPRSQAVGRAPIASGTEKESTLKIAELQRQGLSRDDAAAVAYGFKAIVTDPVSGGMFMVDKRTNQRTPIQTPGSTERPDLAKETQRKLEDDAIRIERVLPLVRNLKTNLSEVGVVGVGKEIIGKTLGQFSDKAVSAQNVEQRAELRRARQALIDSGRMSNQEGQRLLEMWPSDGVFESPGRARLVLDQIDKFLTSQHQDTTQRLGRGPRVAAPVPRAQQGEWKIERVD